MVLLTKRYRFSASHRLHNEELSAEENRRVFGKCNSPYGHGHNYIVEVTVGGPVDAATGMVMDLGVLDKAVEQEVLSRFDHTYLNLDVPNFKGKVPTTENLCVEIYNLLREKVESAGGDARLEKVRLEETSSNSFEYSGADNDAAAMRGKI
ncbi:MAG TPA: 6-carboxytetrahydropterin synthase [Terriglobia bacterium]|nr:6-carboxytetrahydropterin synthase [Terriglobia bacterium]